MLRMNYGTYDNFKAIATKRDLINLYGIGPYKAAQIINEVKS
jgi:DNA uptake protein ComE-like DNA-binding protein